LPALHNLRLTSPPIGSPRPEAPPLPRKLGEIGYVPPAQSESEMTQVDLNENEPALPTRHPADRASDEPASSSNQSPSANTTATNEASQPKKNRSWTFGGISIWSFIRLFLLLCLIAATGVVWWYTVKRFQETTSKMNQDQENNFSWSSGIFVHVAFSVVALFELVFLERNIFRLRAERYMFKHGMSPDARRAAALGIAPWNRPPLPTYAAALAESGHGTGDVEDNLSMYPPNPHGFYLFLELTFSLSLSLLYSCHCASSSVRSYPWQCATALVDAPQQPSTKPQPHIGTE
jgi:hypothetical protein